MIRDFSSIYVRFSTDFIGVSNYRNECGIERFICLNYPMLIYNISINDS